MDHRHLPVDVFSISPFANIQPDVQVSERDKSAATLLFCGVFLGLVGITFSVMGWNRREDNNKFEWTQLLGPIFLSVGLTFALISVCKFKLLSCKLCKRNEDTAPEPEQPQTGQSFVFTGIHQPITFHGATVVQYIPPSYNAQDTGAVSSPLAAPVLGNNGSSVPGVMSPPIFPPQYYSIYTMDNPAFVEEGTAQQPAVHGNERFLADRGQSEQLQSMQPPSGPPPSYEDIYRE